MLIHARQYRLVQSDTKKAIMENTAKSQASITPQFYRLPQLKKRLGVSGSSIWLWVKKGTFPAPIKLAENTTAWRADDIDNWAAARIEASRQLKAANDE